MLPAQTLDLIFLIVIGGIVITHTFKGFFSSLFGLIKSILVFVLTYLYGGRVAAWLSQTWISAMVRDRVHDELYSMYQASAGSFQPETILQKIPSFLQNSKIAEQLRDMESTGEALVESATETIAPAIAGVLSSILGYLAVLLVAGIVLSIASLILNRLIARITFLKVVNRLLGAVVGFLIAILLSMVAASLLKFFFANDPMITESIAIRCFAGDTLLSIFRFLDIGALFRGAIT